MLPCKNPLTPHLFLYVLMRVSQILVVPWMLGQWRLLQTCPPQHTGLCEGLRGCSQEKCCPGTTWREFMEIQFKDVLYLLNFNRLNNNLSRVFIPFLAFLLWIDKIKLSKLRMSGNYTKPYLTIYLYLDNLEVLTLRQGLQVGDTGPDEVMAPIQVPVKHLVLHRICLTLRTFEIGCLL